MDYSPFNPLVWGLFIGFAAATWLIVHLFQKKYPDYPLKTINARDPEALTGDRPPENRGETGTPPTGPPADPAFR